MGCQGAEAERELQMLHCMPLGHALWRVDKRESRPVTCLSSILTETDQHVHIWVQRQRKRTHWECAKLTLNGMGEGKEDGGDTNCPKGYSIPYTSCSAINQGKEKNGVGSLSSKVSIAQRLAAHQFAFASCPQSFFPLLNYLYFGPQVFLLFLFLFSPMSCWREWRSEQVVVWVFTCWPGSTHHSITKLFNIIWMFTVADFISKYMSIVVYIKLKRVFMPKIRAKTSSC